MPTYICARCDFKTSQRANFKRHLTRKIICIPTHKDVSIKSIADSYGIIIDSTKTEFTHTNSNTKNQQLQTLKHTHAHTSCKYCQKQFNTANSCYRHQKHYCKYKKKEITLTQDELNRKIEEKAKKIKEDADKIKEEAEKKIEEEKKKIDVIADKRAQKMVLALANKLAPNQTTNSHNTQNIKTQNIQNNNNNQQLKINNFGEEKTHYITDEQLKIMFVDPRNTVIQHIKDTHYHLLHPENFNAKITNYK